MQKRRSSDLRFIWERLKQSKKGSEMSNGGDWEWLWSASMNDIAICFLWSKYSAKGETEKEKKRNESEKSLTFSGKCQLFVLSFTENGKKVDRKCQATNKSPSTIILTCFQADCGLHPSIEYEKLCYQIFTSEKNWGKKSEIAHAHQACRKDRSNDKFASILIFFAIMNAVAQQPHRCGLIQNNFRFSHCANNKKENEKKILPASNDRDEWR